MGWIASVVAMTSGCAVLAGCSADSPRGVDDDGSSDVGTDPETSATGGGPDTSSSASSTSDGTTESSSSTLADASSSASEGSSSSDDGSSDGSGSESSSEGGTTGDQVCGDEDLGDALPLVTPADAVGDEWQGTCGGAGGEDHAVQWTAPSSGGFIFATTLAGTQAEFDTVLYVRDGCDGPELACDDDSGGFEFSAVAIELVEGQPVVVVVDGADVSEGMFELLIQAVPAPVAGVSCCENSHPDAGCEVPELEQCVCAFDDYCCYAVWDEQCAQEAVNLCAAICP